MLSIFVITFSCVLVQVMANTTLVLSSSTIKQSTTSTPAPSDKSKLPSAVSTTTLEPKQECLNANSCEDCVKIGSVQCVWCQSSKKCTLKESIIPKPECSLSDAKWAVCWLNYMALIIACSVIGVVIILALTICICCCCCCKKNNRAKNDREDARIERKKEEMKAKHSERRAERNAKTDEIRRKYGLFKEANPYTKFDDAAENTTK